MNKPDTVRARDRSGEVRTFKVGDYVDFKADIEQSGQIVEIIPVSKYLDRMPELVLENKHGFGGEYLRYDTTTRMRCDEVWHHDS